MSSYQHQAFPKWMYHATEPAKVVNSQEELEALGDDWAEHPELVAKLEASDDETSAGEPKRPKKPPKKAE